MRVLEACWKDDTALRGLLGFMGGLSSNLKTLTWDLPSCLEPDLLWPECRSIALSLECHGMCRVVNALKAFRLMKKPEGKGSVRVSVTDDVLPENTGIYRISWENGEGDARKVKSGEVDMECSIAALAQMVTGYLSFEQACFRNDVVVNGKAEELGKLFVKKDVYIADKF
jgi:predicted acetyltransferase